MIRHWPRPSDYRTVWEAMQRFTAERDENTADEIWLVEHPPVYTLGQAGKPEHLLNPGNIPVVQTDRGGQVTYHGPGQIMAYVLMDLKRANRFIKAMVNQLEQATIDTLAVYGLKKACRKEGAPGVYVPSGHDLAKIAALGIKVRNGCTYHGMALNVAMELSPFNGINPCGYAGLQTVCMADYGVTASWEEVAQTLSEQITRHCGLQLD
ncbi:lipoyl(octanoyl) transferase LipB [Orrella sp. NBD-18]|uniref:Octanoyltransferase n=1 Tax=Sheuella amnicola TaxID=2707330 RepID=A0A6B2QZF2_9BURK|nr:lipoyl(octanoyl) transferase LipB [Sheuella amnicola]NDY83421.1 lipoyl(octanoyl) transferase LipB [Sheuella amnicola]